MRKTDTELDPMSGPRWLPRDSFCDKCLATAEANEETPTSELCDCCKLALVDWSIQLLGVEGAERMLKILDAHRRDED